MKTNIVLIGMAGVGKSVIGRELAKRLKHTFLDIDELIEQNTKLKLQQIIDRFGNDRFTEIEEETVLQLGKLDGCVISPGGSVIYSAKAMEFLKECSVIVFLDDSFESIRERLTNEEIRGIVGLKEKDLKTLFNERRVLYKKYADMTVKIPREFDADVVIEEIIRGIDDTRE